MGSTFRFAGCAYAPEAEISQCHGVVAGCRFLAHGHSPLDFWTEIGYTLGRSVCEHGSRVSSQWRAAHGDGRRTGGLTTAAGQVGTEPEGSRDRGRKRSGMVVPRVFSTEGVSPFDQVDWELRTAEIKDERGPGRSSSRPTARSPGPGASSPPTSWSSKYFYGELNTPERETSVRQLDRPRDPDDRRLGPRRRLLRHAPRTPSGSTTS